VNSIANKLKFHLARHVTTRHVTSRHAVKPMHFGTAKGRDVRVTTLAKRVTCTQHKRKCVAHSLAANSRANVLLQTIRLLIWLVLYTVTSLLLCYYYYYYYYYYYDYHRHHDYRYYRLLRHAGSRQKTYTKH